MQKPCKILGLREAYHGVKGSRVFGRALTLSSSTIFEAWVGPSWECKAKLLNITF